MKNILLLVGCLLWVSPALSQHGETACECPSCLAKAEAGGGFTLPGLQGLEIADEHAECDHDHPGEAAEHDEHAGLDHAGHDTEPVPHDHDGDGVPDHASHDELDDHEGHDHGAHDGHDHGEIEGIKLTQEVFDTLGIEIREATLGSIAETSTFPAEIKLNRDTTAAISPRYASVVREVNTEIGEKVEKGAVLAALENRETLSVYKLTAPHAGVIISKDLAVGEVVGDDKVLFEVADLSSVWADINVFPQYQHVMHKGMSVDFIARDGCRAAGSIKYISPILSHQTRTFTARCVLRDARADFTPGAFVRASVVVAQVDAVLVVPRGAVHSLDGESVVFVPSPNGFVPQVVSLGTADDQHVEITAGLEAGDKYVAAGAFALKAQMVTSGMDPHAGHGH